MPEYGTHQRSCVLEQTVTRRMSVGVIDLLEAVEIDVKDGDPGGRCRQACLQLAEMVHEIATVGQAGELVVQRCISSPAVGLLELAIADLGKPFGFAEFIEGAAPLRVEVGDGW